MDDESPTYAEIMVKNLEKIAVAISELQATPLPNELIMLYVQKRTRLPKKDIQAVFDAVKELNQKVKKKQA